MDEGAWEIGRWPEFHVLGASAALAYHGGLRNRARSDKRHESLAKGGGGGGGAMVVREEMAGDLGFVVCVFVGGFGFF